MFNIATGKPIHLEKIAYLLCKKIKDNKKKKISYFLIADIKKISRIYNLEKKFRNNLSISIKMKNLIIVIPTLTKKKNILKLQIKYTSLFQIVKF